MNHESFKKEIKIEDSKVTFDGIYNKCWFPHDVFDEVKKANVLIVPTDYNTDDMNVVFPETTPDFLDYLRQTSSENVICDIAISDDNFRRMEKHSALIELATVLVDVTIVPIVINMISSYLYDLVSRYRRTPKDTSAKIKILAEETETKRTVEIKYEGPVNEAKEVMETALKNTFK